MVWRRWFCVAAVGFVSCTTQLTVPPDAEILCSTQEECPTGFECVTSLGKCVAPGGDTERPNVESGSFAVDLTAVPAGQTVQFTFRVSEPLGQSPVVTVVWNGAADGSAVATEVSYDPTTREYVFSYTSTGTEPGTPASVVIDLVDESGNTGGGLFESVVVFDAAAPSLFSATIGLQPRVGILAPNEVTDAGIDAMVSVAINVSEALDASSIVRFTGDPSIVFNRTSESGTSYVYEHVLASSNSYPQGAAPLELVARDAAGNEATLALGSVTIDTQPPASPDVGTQDLILLRRSPWGDADNNPSLLVRGGSGAVEANSVVVIASNSDAAALSTLGQSDADMAGAFNLPLSGADRASAFIVSVDRANNASAVVPIAYGEWVATLGGRIFGNDFSNPNRIRTHVNTTPTRENALGQEPSQSVLDSMVALNGATNAARAQHSFEWAERSKIPSFGFPLESPAAFLQDEGVFLNYGGPFSLLGDRTVKAWDGSGWSAEPPQPGSPLPCYGCSSVQDPFRDGFFMFGGFQDYPKIGFPPPPVSTESWLYRAGAWEDVTPSNPTQSPTGRGFHRMALIEATGEVLLFGGCADYECTTTLGDTWLWDGEFWNDVSPSTGPTPSARAFHSMTYDRERGEVVLFGGCAVNPPLHILSTGTDCTAPLGDTWTWSNGVWEERCDGSMGETDYCATIPPARALAPMAYSRYIDRPVMLGGIDGVLKTCGGTPDVVVREDAWEWTGSEWIERMSTGVPCLTPSPLVTHSPYAEFLLSGVSASSVTFELWSIDGTDTQRLSYQGNEVPVARVHPAMAYDEAHDTLVMFGGRNLDGDCDDDDPAVAYCFKTWLWDGAGWSSTPEIEPAGREDTAMAYHRQRETVFMYGGGGFGSGPPCDSGTVADGDNYCDWLWELDLDDGMWSVADNCAGTCPEPRRGAALTYNPTNQNIIMFGGSIDADFFGGTCPAHADQDGTTCYFGDLWRWTGTAWQERCGGATTTACGPAPRTGGSLAFNQATARLHLFGGCNDGCGTPDTMLDDLWQYGGTNWVQLCGEGTSCSGPDPRPDPSLLYDPVRARSIVIQGGYRDGFEDTELFVWEDPAWVALDHAGGLLGKRARHAAAFDTTRGAVAVFGGFGPIGDDADELYTLDISKSVKPNVRASVVWTAANVPTNEITGVRIRSSAGGTGYDTDITLGGDSDLYGSPVDGVVLEAWNAELGVWEPWDTIAAAFNAPIDTTFSWSGDARDLVSLSDQQIRVRWVTEGEAGNGPVPAEVLVDYFEIAVQYNAAF